MFSIYGSYGFRSNLTRDSEGAIPYGDNVHSRRTDASKVSYSSSLPFTPQYVQSNLDVPNPAALYKARVSHQQLKLENPALRSAAKLERDERRARKQKQAHIKKLNLPKRTEKGIWKLKKEERRFDIFVRLHSMWMDYMSELLALQPLPSSNIVDQRVMPSSAGMHAKLVKADFHGSYLTVRRSKNYALVDVAGIVILETENTFRVITKKNQVKQIPKHGSVFAVAIPLYSTYSSSELNLSSAAEESESKQPSPLRTVLDMPHIELELYGSQFQYRSGERVGRKFKAKETIEL